MERQKKEEKKISAYNPMVPAVEQASEVLLCLGRSSKPKMTLTEICKEVGIHKSKGHSILNTLKHFGFVEKDDEGKTYRLGPGLLFLSRNVIDNLYYPDIVGPFLAHLAEETHATALFGLVNGEHVFVVSRHEGNQNIGFTLRLGHSFHLTLGAHGKAIVAFMPKEERERILAKKSLHFHGDPSRLDMRRLKEELILCQQLGYAQDMGEITPGVYVVSAPIFSLNEKVVGCIILMGALTEGAVGEYGPKIAEAAKKISYKLGARMEVVYRSL